MPSIPPSPDTCIAEALVCLLASEEELARACSEALTRGIGDAGAERFVRDVAALCDEHRARIRGRMVALGIESEEHPAAAAEMRGPVGRLRSSSVVSEVANLVYRAVTASVITMHLGVRHRDSWVAAAEGTTALLGRQHMQEYQLALGRVPVVLGEAVLRDLDRAGEPCACTCPACSNGICMCGQPIAWREAHRGALARMQPEYIRLPAPRPGSPAALAGLQEGDEVVEVADVPIDTLATLMTGFKEAESSPSVAMVVRRGEKELALRLHKTAGMLIPGAIEADAAECIQPSGQEFYLDRARDLQRQVRRGGKPIVPHPDGLRGLSARELQVLRLVADGATNPMIAERLQIARPTVARHVASILAKLGTANRAEAAGLAAAQGFRLDV